MSKQKSIGKWFIGIGAALAFVARQKLAIYFKGVYLNGIISTELIPLKVVVSLINNTVVGVLVRSISGALISSDGKIVATVNQAINKRIPAHRVVEQGIAVDIHNREALQALMANVQTGDVNNLAFEFIGEVVVGEQWPVGIKFNRVFTWQDIQKIV